MSLTMNSRSHALKVVPATTGFNEPFPFMRPSLPELSHVFAEYQPAYRNGVLTNAGLVCRLEAAVAERLSVKHCVAVSSCTSGLMMVLRALGLEGEVILPSFTFFATGHSVLWNGLKPVFADCDPHTWNINPAEVERKITADTSAILAVHMYGNPCDVAELEAIARRHNLKLVFDAAHAFGTHYRGVPTGSFGDAEVFSLSPTKLLVAGEGGLVTTNDAKLAAAVRAMRNYGDVGAYNPKWLGLNARMTEFNAAMALAGLPLVKAKVQRRSQIAQMYTEKLSHIPGIRFQKVDPGDTHTYKDYSVLVVPEIVGLTRDLLAESLRTENIETKKYFYPPLHQQHLYSIFHEFGATDLAQTEHVANNVLSLPIYESLPDETICIIADTFERIVRLARARKAS